MTEQIKISSEIPKMIKPIIRKGRTLRSYVPEPVKNFESLDSFEDVKRLIIAGWTPSKVASFMVNEYPDDFDKMDKDEDELAVFIGQYRKRIPPGELIAIRMPGEMIKARDRIKNGLDVISEIESLYKMQKERINIDYNTEKKLGKLFKTTGGEIEIASRMLREYYEIRKTMGLDQNDPIDSAIRTKLISDFSVRYGKESVNNVLASQESVSKVLSFAEDLFTNMKSGEAVKLLEEISKSSDKEYDVSSTEDAND